jgi:hypothetical protein
MSVIRVTMYAIAMTLCAITAGVSTAAYVMGSSAAPAYAKRLPKPTPNCPECRDATSPLAAVKE